MQHRLAPIALVAALGFLLGALVALVVLPDARRRILAPLLPATEPAARVGGPFTLVDHRGLTVTEKHLRGRHRLMVFGFTRSPGMTPASLQLVAAVLDRLGARGDRVVPLFVTLDAEHDGPGVLAAFVARFHPRLVGLTGTVEEVERVARLWHVDRRKAGDAVQPGEDAIAAPALIYLMGPEGRYITHFAPSASVDDVALRLAAELF